MNLDYLFRRIVALLTRRHYRVQQLPVTDRMESVCLVAGEAPVEWTADMKDRLVRSVRSSMMLSGLEPLPYEESRAMLEEVLLEPPLVFGEVDSTRAPDGS